MTDAEMIAELKRLDGERTRSPWKMDTKENAGENWMIGCVIDCGSGETEDGQRYSDYLVSTDQIHASELTGLGARADAQFIAFAANALPRLLALAEAGLRAEEMREALQRIEGGFWSTDTVNQLLAGNWQAVAQEAQTIARKALEPSP